MDTDEHRDPLADGRGTKAVEEWIPISSAAERLGVSDESVLAWCESGAVPWRLPTDGESAVVEWGALAHHHQSLSGNGRADMPEWVEELVESWKRSAETDEEMRFLGRQVAEIQGIFEDSKRQADELHLAMRRESDRAAAQAAHAALSAQKAAALVAERSIVSARQELAAKTATDAAASARRAVDEVQETLVAHRAETEVEQRDRAEAVRIAREAARKAHESEGFTTAAMNSAIVVGRQIEEAIQRQARQEASGAARLANEQTHQTTIDAMRSIETAREEVEVRLREAVDVAEESVRAAIELAAKAARYEGAAAASRAEEQLKVTEAAAVKAVESAREWVETARETAAGEASRIAEQTAMNAGRIAADGIQEEATTIQARVIGTVQEAARSATAEAAHAAEAAAEAAKRAEEQAKRGAIAKEAQQETARAAWLATRAAEQAAESARKEAEARDAQALAAREAQNAAEVGREMAEQARDVIAQSQAWARRQFADQEMLQSSVDEAVRTAREAIEEARTVLVEIAQASSLLKQEWDQARTAQSELVKEAAGAAKAAKGAARAAQASSVAAQKDATRAARASTHASEGTGGKPGDYDDVESSLPDEGAWPRLFDVPPAPWDDNRRSVDARDDTDPGDELLFPVVPDEDEIEEGRWGGSRILGRFGFGRTES